MDANNAKTNELQELLTGALIGMAHAHDGNEDLAAEMTDLVMLEGLYTSCHPDAYSKEELQALLGRIRTEKFRFAPDCAVCKHPCGKNADFDMNQLRLAEKEKRILKTLLLMTLRGMAPDALSAAQSGRLSGEILDFIYRMLCVLGEDWPADGMAPFISEAGYIYLRLTACRTSSGTDSLDALADGLRTGSIRRVIIALGCDEAQARQKFPSEGALIALPFRENGCDGKLLSIVQCMNALSGSFDTLPFTAALCRYDPAPIAALTTLLRYGCRDFLLSPKLCELLPEDTLQFLAETYCVAAAFME